MAMAKFDKDGLVKLIKESRDCVDILVEQDKIIQEAFTDLGDTFKDSGYAKYEASANEGAANVRNMVTLLNDMSMAAASYGQKMMSLK